MAKPGSVAGDILNYYGNGANASQGPNNKTFYYDMAGIKAANRKKVYAQFADSRQMPQRHGKEYRVKVQIHSYDRMPYEETSLNTIGGKKTFTSDFSKLGYISGRNLADLTNYVYGSDGKDYTGGTYTNNGVRLLEGEGPANKFSLKDMTITTRFEKFGEMIEYTDEVVLFSEDPMQVRYREELGERANCLYEDLLQLELLATPTVMYAGTATSLETLGTGIGAGTPDPVTLTNAIEESYKINYGLIQKAVQKLFRNRAPKHTSILKGDVRIGTTPINAAYVAIVGPEVKLDIENMIRGVTYEKNFVFTPVYMYANQTTIMENEFGRVNDIRFIVSESAIVERGRGAVVDPGYTGRLSYTNVDKTGGGKENRFDVFPILIPCAGSFATIGLAGANKIEFMSLSPNDVSILNPFKTKGFFAYKFWFAALITRPERLLRINVLASA
ncbi:TPA: N4-gp56 family major capsid protein [Campylobacter coli]|nr:N4-gp56 family major capsid protein [Campylobacter coli]